MERTKLTYKKKKQLLLAVTVLFLFFAYFFGIRKTVALHQELNDAQQQLTLAMQADEHIAVINQKIATINNRLGNLKKDTSSVQEQILTIVTGYCNANTLVLKQFPKTVSHTENDFLVETNAFTVQGPFSKLLRLIYEFEQRHKIAKVVSVRFLAKEDVRTKIKELTATIYLQSIKKSSNEI